jgi:hypothetical protein
MDWPVPVPVPQEPVREPQGQVPARQQERPEPVQAPPRGLVPERLVPRRA